MADEKDAPLYIENVASNLEKQQTRQVADGTIKLFSSDGELRLIPVASNDPNGKLSSSMYTPCSRTDT